MSEIKLKAGDPVIDSAAEGVSIRDAMKLLQAVALDRLGYFDSTDLRLVWREEHWDVDPNSLVNNALWMIDMPLRDE
ncbi:hypothetical protein KPL78_00890 [Roseomonas sp. HJA6]|uniref:Uncharacterized protein n=1 Tax=Roseomonas alba TaxID=2846776 RepID=A0ABS7A246_9PROT|nr:hypothetical protein [Neoroseomonas alba]MBW6396376.1 hypothetical protein [Neoroseomonas alba]